LQSQKSFFGRFRKQSKKTKKTNKNGSFSLECPYSFGYLTHLPKNIPIPDNCMFCIKLINCRYNNGNE
jgi:hypothetical protein